MSYPLLEKAPKDHHSDEFIEFIRKNNVVIFDLDQWLVIENCKYHHKDGNKAWWTAFYNGDRTPLALDDVSITDFANLSEMMPRSWEIRIKKASDRTVDRFHVHLIE